MKFRNVILLITSFIATGCAPTLLFTYDQFDGYYSDNKIPDKCHGQWTDSNNFYKTYIDADSFSIGGLDYKIIDSNMKLNDTLLGQDKIIFQDDWCFISRSIDDGFQICLAKIDIEGNIKCWVVGYDYFLDNQIVNKIPTIHFTFQDIPDSYNSYQEVNKIIVYAEIDEDIGNLAYKRFIKKATISTSIFPYYCDKSFDIEFFKKFAQSREPDIFLTKDKNVIYRKENKLERRYEKISKKNYWKKYSKLFTS